MSARDEGLTVAIVDGRLSITIGIDALMTAAKGGDAWDEELGDEIEDVDGFAEDIRQQLVDEADDGTTLVHLALDTAVQQALDVGSLNIRYGSDAGDAGPAS